VWYRKRRSTYIHIWTLGTQIYTYFDFFLNWQLGPEIAKYKGLTLIMGNPSAGMALKRCRSCGLIWWELFSWSRPVWVWKVENFRQLWKCKFALMANDFKKLFQNMFFPTMIKYIGCFFAATVFGAFSCYTGKFTLLWSAYNFSIICTSHDIFQDSKITPHLILQGLFQGHPVFWFFQI
jgi:hypothetical protein